MTMVAYGSLSSGRVASLPQRPHRRWRACRGRQSVLAATAFLDFQHTATSAATAAWQLVEPPLGTAAGLTPDSATLSAHEMLSGRSLQPVLGLTSLDLYSLIDQVDQLVAQQLTGLSPLSFVIVLGAGLLTSLSPCTLSVLPLTIGYIGGYSSSEADGSASSSLVVRSASFAAGLATSLALLGVASALLGNAYGQIGDGLPVAVAAIAILMGLNLLEVVPLRLPSLDVDVRSLSLPPALQAYLAGLTFALAASPCSTPILATLLAYVGTTRDPVAGGALLLAYALGYVGPLLVAALFSGALARLLAARQWSAWVTPTSGVLLVVGGTYALLSRLAPA